MAPRALVVGGTGPTGPHIVNGLRARGHATAILHRGTHEIDRCAYPVAFFSHRGRTLIVHASEWNRLEVSDPRANAAPLSS